MTGFLHLVFFNARADYLTKALPVGETRVVSGKLERFGSELQITHPDYIVPPDEASTIPTVEAIYPMTAGLTPKVLGKAIREAVARAPDLPEWLDAHYLRRQVLARLAGGAAGGPSPEG